MNALRRTLSWLVLILVVFVLGLIGLRVLDSIYHLIFWPQRLL